MAYKERNYFITARHVIPDEKTMNNSRIIKGAGFVGFDLKWIGSGVGGSDISVMALPNTPKINQPVPISGVSLDSIEPILGEDVVFLGFPAGMELGYTSDVINRDFPIAYVHKGIISSLGNVSEEKPYFWIHADVTSGVSGGPVIAYNRSKSKPKKIDFHIIGVACMVMTKKITSSGQGHFVPVPVGFTGAVWIGEATNLIDKYLEKLTS